MTADWIVQDPGKTQSYNRYSYVWNNPVRYTDPTGNFIPKPMPDNLNLAAFGNAVGNAVLGEQMASYYSMAVMQGMKSDAINFAQSYATQSLGGVNIVQGSNNGTQAIRLQGNSSRVSSNTTMLPTIFSFVAERAVDAIQTNSDEWLKVLQREAPNWTRGLGKARSISGGAAVLGIALESPAYFEIMNARNSGKISNSTAAAALAVHTGAIGLEILGTGASAFSGAAFVGAMTGGPGASYGAIGGAVVGGSIVSTGIDAIENRIFERMGIK